MANFSSLKQAIQNYIKENGNKEITGNLLQEILLSMVQSMGDQAINGLSQMLSNEMIARENADWNLSQALTTEQQRAIAEETKSAVLDGETKMLVFKNAAGQELYQVSVASLISNGLVDVDLDGTNLVMTFHTDSGDEEITIPIGDIFNPSNYYTKTQVDNLLLPITTAITNVSSRLNEGYIYLGVADPETIPTSETGKFFYIASQAGTYHFMANGDIPIVISSNGLYILSGGVEADDWFLETIVTFTSNVQFNNAQLITSGGVFNAILPINDLLRRNYMLAGVADTTTIPAEDTNVFYLAGHGGTYTHFLNGDDEPLVLQKGLTVIYRGVEDDGWNYWVVYTDNDFINTNRAQALTSNQQTEAQNNLEGKSYAPAQFSGLGKKMLAKNIQQVGGVNKNVMTQAFFSESNTVYVIQYDYTLGENVTIPTNCVLQFDGGSISGGNYTIDLNGCDIVSPMVPILPNTKLSSVYTKEIHVEWFGIIPGEAVDAITIANLVRYCRIIRFGEGTFNFASSITITDNDAVAAIIGAEHGRHRFPKTHFTFSGFDCLIINSPDKRIEGIEFNGNDSGVWDDTTKQFNNVYCGIKVTKSFYAYRCAFVECGYGIYSVSGDLVSLFVRFSEFRYCKNDGIYLNPTTLNNAIIEGNYFVSNGKDGGVNNELSTETYSGSGLTISKGNGVNIVYNVFEYNAGCGLLIKNTSEVQNSFIGTIIGNHFEHNKYTQVYIGRDNGLDKIECKGNFYTDAGIALPSNALAQRTCTIKTDPSAPFNNNFITLEDLNSSSLKDAAISDKKALFYSHCFSEGIVLENDEPVSQSSDSEWNRSWGIFRIPVRGHYRIVIEAKVNGGSVRFVAFGLQVVGKQPVDYLNLTFNSTSYTKVGTLYQLFDEGETIRINAASYIDSRSPSNNVLTIKNIILEKINEFGATAERPDVGYLPHTAIGITYYNTTENKLQVFNGTAWADV